MPTDKDFKRLIRQRVADTGERYTQARAALMTGHQPDRPQSPLQGEKTPDKGERLEARRFTRFRASTASRMASA